MKLWKKCESQRNNRKYAIMRRLNLILIFALLASIMVYGAEKRANLRLANGKQVRGEVVEYAAGDSVVLKGDNGVQTTYLWNDILQVKRLDGYHVPDSVHLGKYMSSPHYFLAEGSLLIHGGDVNFFPSFTYCYRLKNYLMIGAGAGTNISVSTIYGAIRVGDFRLHERFKVMPVADINVGCMFKKGAPLYLRATAGIRFAPARRKFAFSLRGGYVLFNGSKSKNDYERGFVATIGFEI